jgi:type I restriction enzyme R subunit
LVAPLQHLRSVRGDEPCYRFDLLLTRLQVELLRGGPDSSRFSDFRSRVQEVVEQLPRNLEPVKACAGSIRKVRDGDFWASVDFPSLEALRRELRGILRFWKSPPAGSVTTPVFDVEDSDVSGETYVPRLEGFDLIEYRRRVGAVLDAHFATNPVLQAIRAGQAVREDELEELVRLVLEIDDKANIRYLAGHDPKARRSLLAVFRGLVGLDEAAIEAAFSGFVRAHPGLTSRQLRFLQVLQNHIAQNGGIELERLYEPPFTTLDAESVDGIFPEPQAVDDLLAILVLFEPGRAAAFDAAAPRKAS